MMLLLCNLVVGGFAIMVTTVVVRTTHAHTHPHTHTQNLGQQFLQISRMETTYFDAEGRGAYKKKRSADL